MDTLLNAANSAGSDSSMSMPSGYYNIRKGMDCVNKLHNGKYLYNCPEDVQKVDFYGYGENGRIYRKFFFDTMTEVYYLCISNCAVDSKGWKHGDALIPVIISEHGFIDIARTCDFNALQELLPEDSRGHLKITPSLVMSGDYSLQPTGMALMSTDADDFKANCWFRDIAYDYDNASTRNDVFMIDHDIPYAKHNPGFKYLQLYTYDYDVSLEYSSMVDRRIAETGK